MKTRILIVKALNDFFISRRSIDYITAVYSKDAKYQAAFGSVINGVVKMRMTIDFYINEISSISIYKIDKVVLNILRAGIYELHYTENEEYGVVDTYVEIAKKLTPKTKNFVNAILRNFLRKRSGIKIGDLASQYSFQPWMIKKWLQEYGKDNTIKICEFFNTSAPLTLKVNTLQVKTDDLIKRLEDQGIACVKSTMVDDCLIVKHKGSVPQIYGFDEGLWHVQSEPSCITVDVLDPKEGETILDVCAAPGSKTCYIAQKTKDNAEILACDINKFRLEKIQENIERLGIVSIEKQVKDGTKATFDKDFDKILVDVPCSNTGVLAKRADARWNKKRDDIESLNKVQFALIENAARNLKPNGEIVYSTCSMEKEENTQIVQKFLKHHKDFTLVWEKQFLPFVDDTEGFYIAKLQKTS